MEENSNVHQRPGSRRRIVAVAGIVTVLAAGAPAVSAAAAPAGMTASTSTPIRTTAPAAPTNLVAVAGDRQATLTWNAPSGAVSYRVFRNSTLVAQPTSARFTDTGLANGTTYTYYVRAVNSARAISAASSTVRVTPKATILPPTGLTATPGDSQAALTWAASAGAVSYRVFRNYDLIGTPTGTGWVDSGLTNGTTYKYYVRSVSSTGSISEPSATISAKPVPSAPSAPTGLAAVSGNGSATLTWTPTAGASTYDVLRDGGKVATTTAPQFADTGLVNGRTYGYAVRAVNAVGASPASAGVNVTPVAPTPVASSSPTRLAWFYKPPFSDESVVLKEFDTFILSKGDETFVSKVRAEQPSAQIMQYFMLTEIVKPDSGGVEWRNNAANRPGDFNDLLTNHRDWFLEDANGNLIVDEGRYYMMDPGNAEWQAYWLAKFKESSVGWDGLFLDNIPLSLIMVERHGVKARDYATDEAFTDAVSGFLSRIRQEYAVPSGKPMSGNLVHGGTTRNAASKYFGSLDGYMEEGFGADWHTGYLSTTAWNAQLDRVDSFTSQGKSAVLVAQSDSQTDAARQRFTFASYLLVSGPTVSFRFTKSGAYRYAWMYDNYGVQLGTPLGPRRTLGDGSVRRDFAGGYVVVNPTTRTASIVTQ